MELSLFERFVESTEFIVRYGEAHSWMGLLFSGVIVLFNWFIFRYHHTILEDHYIFRENIHIVGRFCSTTYNMWKWIAVTFVPFGVLVLVYSLYTRFDSIEFVRLYGIRKALRSWDNVQELPRGPKKKLLHKKP